MIKKLQRKFTLIVTAALFVIVAGIVFAINFVNSMSIVQQAEASLQILVESEGRRPGFLPQKPEADSDQVTNRPPPTDSPTFRANLSNYCAIRLNEDGSVAGWFSDRPDLYTDEQIQSLSNEVLQSGSDTGCLGGQHYQLAKRPDGLLLVVLDCRLDYESAGQLLLTTVLIGITAWVLASLGAAVLVRRMILPVQEAFDRQKQFVSDASHELKTPLAVIGANADVLAQEYGENRWVDYIQSEVRRTGKLVQNLLDLARMDSGKAAFVFAPFDLSNAVLSVALPFESTAFEQGSTLHLDITEGLHLDGDEERIKQLVVILLGNALKYTSKGGVVTLSLLPRGDKKALRVHNTGAGINKEDLPRLFDRFYRGDPSRSRNEEGSGLGLAIAHTIVEAHRGKITVESDFAHWTCFTVIL